MAESLIGVIEKIIQNHKGACSPNNDVTFYFA